MNIVDPILFQCRHQPPIAAICVPGPGISLISYQRLEKFVHNISRRLHMLGLPPKSIVAVNIQDVIFHTAVVLALIRLGAITLSLRDSDSSAPVKIDLLITTEERPFVNIGMVVLVDLSWTEGDGHPLESQLLPPTHEDDFCRIILTSGSTNEPKAVAVTHRLLAARINRHLTVFGNRFANCYRIYSDVPISSSLGFQFLIYALWRGGTAFFPGDNFERTLRVFEQYKVQALVGSPGGFENMLRWFDTVPAYQSNIEALFCGGDVLSQSLSNRLRSRISSHLIAAYGSTEASMTATAQAHEIVGTPRAVGFVTPGVTIQIVDASDTLLAPNQEGYVRIKSEYAVDGYFGSSVESVNAFRDGWFYPGDLGTLGSNNLLVITGREQTILNLGGDKISPETIEFVLSQYGGVIEAAAFSTPNEHGNNEVHAVIMSQGTVDERKLREYCESQLSLNFVPTKFYFSDTIPHNEMGKIDRRRLQEFANQRT